MCNQCLGQPFETLPRSFKPLNFDEFASHLIELSEF